MKLLSNLALIALSSLSALTAADPASDDEKTYEPLRTGLSKGASISFNGSSDPRWSDYHAPKPIAIVNVATAEDVAKTVKFCVAKKIQFLPQNGGHGWISSFDIGSRGVVINLHGLNQVSFTKDRSQATIGGGTLIKEAIDAAWSNNAQITTGNCNCVGTLGAILGGGYGNLMGLNGFGIDTLLSLTYVDAKGELRTITSKDTDLWYAFRGAGPNFGIVTSATVKSKAVAQADNKAFLQTLIFTQDKLEQVIAAINRLKLEPEMKIFFYYVVSEGQPAFIVTPYYYGDEATARKKFAPIIAIGPVVDTGSVLPYNQWNDGAAGFCIKGGRKPAFGAGFQQLKPTVWRQIWKDFGEFTKLPGTENTALLMEAYSLTKARSFPESTASFPLRNVNFNVALLPTYTDPSLDAAAEKFGNKARDLWWSTDDLAANVSYINFAHGDEQLSSVYGQSLPKLQALKKKYDPTNVFNQWFPLIPRK